jgi:hypothetical protein
VDRIDARSLLLNPEDDGTLFLRNVCSLHTDYVALYYIWLTRSVCCEVVDLQRSAKWKPRAGQTASESALELLDFDILTAVIMNTAVVWFVIPWVWWKPSVSGQYNLRLQCWRVSQVRNQHKQTAYKDTVVPQTLNTIRYSIILILFVMFYSFVFLYNFVVSYFIT